MAADLSLQERAIQALQDIKNVLLLWRSGKVTHEASMERVNDIVKKAT